MMGSKLCNTTIVCTRSYAGNVYRVFVGVVLIYRIYSNRLIEGVNKIPPLVILFIHEDAIYIHK